MSFLSVWVKILIGLGFAMFVAWSYPCAMWTERDPKKFKTIMGGIMVSLIYTFRAFLLATVIFVVIYILVTYII